MANHIEFRVVQTLSPNGQVSGVRLQYRTKDVTASVLGIIPLASSWSAWTEIDATIVTEQT